MQVVHISFLGQLSQAVHQVNQDRLIEKGSLCSQFQNEHVVGGNRSILILSVGCDDDHPSGVMIHL